MRELTVVEFGVLLSLFAVLLVAFSADFHLSRRTVRRHRRAAVAFAVVSLVGESATALAMVLTWIALRSEVAWEALADQWVLVPGTIAVGCALILTAEKVVRRAISIFDDDPADDPDAE